MSKLRRHQVAALLVALDGVGVSLAGLVALVGSTEAFQGEQLLLLIAGLALLGFGVMMVFRWNLRAVKTGLVGMTTGYFAAMLTHFEVATDPCDIGSTLAICANHVAGGVPWDVYQGPLILAVLLFFLVALEPYLSEARQGENQNPD